MFSAPIITFNPSTMAKVAEAGGVVAIQHANGYVGLYVEVEGDDFGQISPKLTKNPSKTGAEIAAEMLAA